MEQQWLVVRFPNGGWSSGGSKQDYKDVDGCEFFYVWATERTKAVKKAQAKRSRDNRKSRITA